MREIMAFSTMELYALIRWSPPGGPIAAAINGGPHWMGWTVETDLLRKVAYATTAAVSKAKVKPDPTPDEMARSRAHRGRVSAMAAATPRRIYRDTPLGG